MMNRSMRLRKTMLRRGWVLLALLLSCFAASSAAEANVSTDIHIGTQGCVQGGCTSYQGFEGETTSLSSNTLDVYANNNSNNLTGSVLLFFAVPDLSGDILDQSPIVTATYNNGDVPWQAGPSSWNGFDFNYSNQALGLISGTMTATTGEDLYSFAGLPTNSGNKSNSFANFQKWDAEEGVTANAFLVYAYKFSTSISVQTELDVTYALPKGTFVAGYGLESRGSYADNAFTEAGLTTTDTCTGSGGACSTLPPPNNQNVPEPSSLALLGFGLAALGLYRRRRA